MIKEKPRHSNKPKIQFLIFDLFQELQNKGIYQVSKSDLQKLLLEAGIAKKTIDSNLTELVQVGCLVKPKFGWYSLPTEPVQTDSAQGLEMGVAL